MKLRTAIRMYLPHVIAMVSIVILSLTVAAFIVTHERLRFPWQHSRRLYAEFSNAQAVTPGQGQTINVAGVKVGDIGSVRLERGLALVEMDLTSNDLGPVYRNARLLLRPKTGLNDMSIDLDPGSPDPSLPKAGRLRDGDRLPVWNTLPAVNLDEMLSALDSDTRNYLVTLATAGGQALGHHGPDLRRMIQASEPTLADTRRVMTELADRRLEVARLVRNLRLLTHAAASQDGQLASLVTRSAAVFSTLAAHDADLGTSLDRLPRALTAVSGVLGPARTLANDLRPTLTALEPAVRELTPALVSARPLLRQGTPSLARYVRPLVRETTPLVRSLRPSVDRINRADPSLIAAGKVLTYTVNELGYNPPAGQHSYLFWLAWFMHSSASIMSTDDAQGAVWRGLPMFGCSSSGAVIPQSSLLQPLTHLPLCPSSGPVGSLPGGVH